MSYLLRAETGLHYFLVWLEASIVDSRLIPRRDAKNSISIRNLTARDFKNDKWTYLRINRLSTINIFIYLKRLISVIDTPLSYRRPYNDPSSHGTCTHFINDCLLYTTLTNQLHDYTILYETLKNFAHTLNPIAKLVTTNNWISIEHKYIKTAWKIKPITNVILIIAFKVKKFILCGGGA